MLEERSEISLASFYLPELRSIIFMAKGKRYERMAGSTPHTKETRKSEFQQIGGEMKLVYRQLQRRKKLSF